MDRQSRAAAETSQWKLLTMERFESRKPAERRCGPPEEKRRGGEETDAPDTPRCSASRRRRDSPQPAAAAALMVDARGTMRGHRLDSTFRTGLSLAHSPRARLGGKSTSAANGHARLPLQTAPPPQSLSMCSHTRNATPPPFSTAPANQGPDPPRGSPPPPVGRPEGHNPREGGGTGDCPVPASASLIPLARPEELCVARQALLKPDQSLACLSGRNPGEENGTFPRSGGGVWEGGFLREQTRRENGRDLWR